MEENLENYEWAYDAKWFIGDRNTPEFENWLEREKTKLYRHRTQNGDIWLVGSPLWWDWQTRNLPRGGTMFRFKPRLVAKGKNKEAYQSKGLKFN